MQPAPITTSATIQSQGRAALQPSPTKSAAIGKHQMYKPEIPRTKSGGAPHAAQLAGFFAESLTKHYRKRR